MRTFIYGKPVPRRALSPRIKLPVQKQAAPSTLAGWGRSGLPSTDTLAKPVASFATPPLAISPVQRTAAWSNTNLPTPQGVMAGGASFQTMAPPPSAPTITGRPQAIQRIPIAQGDPTAVRQPKSESLQARGVSPAPEPAKRPSSLPANAPTVTHTTPGYTPRMTVELVEGAPGQWSEASRTSRGPKPTTLALPSSGQATPEAMPGGSTALTTSSTGVSASGGGGAGAPGTVSPPADTPAPTSASGSKWPWIILGGIVLVLAVQ